MKVRENLNFQSQINHSLLCFRAKKLCPPPRKRRL
jgi:hypothetical protein